jgi:hypothetical protein
MHSFRRVQACEWGKATACSYLLCLHMGASLGILSGVAQCGVGAFDTCGGVQIGNNTHIKDAMIMGADYYESEEEKAALKAEGKVCPMLPPVCDSYPIQPS